MISYLGIGQEHTRFAAAFQRIEVIVFQYAYDAAFSIWHLTAKPSSKLHDLAEGLVPTGSGNKGLID